MLCFTDGCICCKYVLLLRPYNQTIRKSIHQTLIIALYHNSVADGGCSQWTLDKKAETVCRQVTGPSARRHTHKLNFWACFCVAVLVRCWSDWDSSSGPSWSEVTFTVTFTDELRLKNWEFWHRKEYQGGGDFKVSDLGQVSLRHQQHRSPICWQRLVPAAVGYVSFFFLILFCFASEMSRPRTAIKLETQTS